MTTTAITADGPNDWLAAIAGWRPYRDTRWGRHKNIQALRARQYIEQRLDGGGATREAVFRRAAVIISARPGALHFERALGMRAALQLEGTDVRCRTCRKTWKCLPEEPCYEATAADDGLCLACMLAETRPDADVIPVEPAAVIGPRKPRKTAARDEAQADEAETADADGAE
jgi:hypothetical protein